MSELLNRVKCPMGCNNANITETTKVISNPNSNLLLENPKEGNVMRVKVYTCHCCGNTFEMQNRLFGDGRVIL